jgi:hypothetical protein
MLGATISSEMMSARLACYGAPFETGAVRALLRTRNLRPPINHLIVRSAEGASRTTAKRLSLARARQEEIRTKCSKFTDSGFRKQVVAGQKQMVAGRQPQNR